MGAAPPGQPYAGLWHLKDTEPNFILNYDLSTDPDAPYMRSGTTLAPRGRNPAFKINAHARSGEGGVTALSSFHAANKNPSQGERTASFLDYYAFAHWHYLDQIVMWGGSAGAGIILAPNPTLIDAGHRSGVPVFGNVFFPPTAYGGKIEWVQAMVQKTGSTYPVADKLIAIANYCGFDGWFVNQETGGGDAALASEVRNFLKYIQSNSGLRIMWYDAMTESGTVSWQNTLNASNDAFFQDGGTLVSDTFFADFGWSAANVTNGANTATGLARSRYELYFGVDVQSDGYDTAANWNFLFPDGAAHRASVGLYQPNWTFDKSGNDSTLFYQRERKFWAGPNEDPSDTPNTASDTDWEGLAHYVQEWSPLQQLPFVSGFNVGHGNRFYWRGTLVRPALDADGVVFNWHNLTTQDILPSWQWALDTASTNRLTPAWYWKDAYTGGSCLRIAGNLDAASELRLYQANLPITPGTTLRIAYRDTDAFEETNMRVALAFADAPGTTVYLDVGNRAGTGWATKSISLAAHAGRTLGYIGLLFDPAATGAIADYSMQMGELAIYDGSPSTPDAPTGVHVENSYAVSATRDSLRLRWTPSASSDVRYYNVYRRNGDGGRTWLWAASRDACFIPALDRAGDEPSVSIEVEAVNQAMEFSTPASTTHIWNNPPTIGNVATQTIGEGESTPALAFSVGDDLTPPGSLVVSGASSNPALVPADAIVFGGGGTNRTVTVTPRANASGAANITVTVTDSRGLSASDSFRVTVVPADGVAGAIARWPFDGTLDDVTGGGWALAHSGVPVFSVATRKQGDQSLAFNGTTDGASSASPLPLGDRFSIAAWIFVPSGTAQIQTIAANSAGGASTDGFRFYVNGFNTGDGKLIFATGNGTVGANVGSAPGAVAFDRWQHVAASVDRAGGAVTLYRNGIAVAAGTIRTDFATAATFHVGAMATQFRFRSHMDEVRLYDHCLSASEIADIVNVCNDAPTISDLADQAIAEDTATPELAVVVGDAETAADALVLTKSSSDTLLVPAANIVLSGSGNGRTVRVTPAPNQSGVATITLTVSDGTQTAIDSFVLTVAADAPITDWRQANFGEYWDNPSVSGNLIDVDRDGAVNIVEYALNGEPNVPSTATRPQARELGGRLALRFARVVAQTDVSIVVQGSDALTGPWADLAASVNGASTVPLLDGVSVTESGIGETRTVEVQDAYPVTDPTHPRRFMRVQVSW